MKITKKLLITISSVSAIATGISVFSVINSLNQAKSHLSHIKTYRHSDQITSQTSTEENKPSFDLNNKIDTSLKAEKFYAQNNIDMPTSKNGPILLHDNARTIAGHDWYGNVGWFITLNGNDDKGAEISHIKFSNSNTLSIDNKKIGKKIVDVAYLEKNDYLYILTDTSYLFLVNATTGSIISHNEIKPENSSNSDKKINKLAFIDFNDSLYAWNSDKKASESNVWNIDTLKLTTTKAMDFSTNNNNDIKDKYILDILPLTVGFNVIVTSSDDTSRSTSSPAENMKKVSIDFIQDDGKKFDTDTSSSGSQNLKKEINLSCENCHQDTSCTTGCNKKKSDIFTKSFKRNENSMIVIVDSYAFGVELNQSDMKSSKFIDLKFNFQTNNSQQQQQQQQPPQQQQPQQQQESNQGSKTEFKNINSAIIDEANNVFVRDDTERLYKITPSNTVDIELNNIKNGNVFSEENSKKTRVFGVNSQTLKKSLTSTYYLAEPEKFTSLGYVQSVAKGTNFNVNNPRFSLDLSETQKGAISPSQIKVDQENNNFKEYGDRNPKMDINNTDLYANDITGELFAKSKLLVDSWYSNKANSKTESIVIGKWNTAKVEDITRWNDSNVLFDIGWSYDLLTDKLLTDNWEKLLSLPSVIDKTKPTTIVKIIIDRERTEYRKENNSQPNSQQSDSKSKIEKPENLHLIAAISYLDPKGRLVSFSIKTQDNSPFILQPVSEKYVFQFAGGDVYDTSLGSDPYNNNENGSSGKEIDVQTLGNQFTIFKNALPSLIDSSSLVLAPFVAQSKKYWVDERRVISAVADDIKGTLKITVVYNNFTTAARQVFSQVYTNFPKMADDWIVFNGKEIEETDFPKYPDGTNAYDTKSIRLITDVKNYVDFDKKLATDLKDSDVTGLFDSKLRGMGFIPSIRIERVDEEQISSDDAQFGSINLILDYSSSISSIWKVQFPESYYERFNLDQEGKITQRYIGLLPIGSTYGINLKDYNSNEIQQIVQNNNIESEFSEKQLLSTLDIKGYVFNLQSSNSNQQNNNEVVLKNFAWNGEDLTFTVHAQSNTYNTVNETKSFVISWSPKFASIRERNLIVASITSILGSTIVSVAVSIYILRRNKIRRMLK